MKIVDIVGLTKFLLDEDIGWMDELSFLAEISPFLPKKYQKIIDKLSGDDDYKYDEFYYGGDDENDDEIKDEIYEQVAEQVNKYTIKNLGCTISIEADGGQGGGALIGVEITFLDDKEEAPNIGTYYHISKKENLQNILKNGLRVKARHEATISYEPSIFLFQKLPKEKELIAFGRRIQGKAPIGMFSTFSAESIHSTLVLFTIHLPSTYEVYFDNQSDYVYVTRNIPSKCITEYVVLKDKPSKKR